MSVLLGGIVSSILWMRNHGHNWLVFLAPKLVAIPRDRRLWSCYSLVCSPEQRQAARSIAFRSFVLCLISKLGIIRIVSLSQATKRLYQAI